jgi:hypothetical protein
MSERAESLSYVIYDVLNNVIKEAQTFNCLGKDGASNILKKKCENKDQSNGPQCSSISFNFPEAR